MLATVPLATAMLICSLIMGPTAMTPTDVADAIGANVGIRAMIWLAVLAALCPAALALFRNRSLIYLRWLPIPRAVHIGTTGLLLIALELPFAIFLLVAGQPLGAAAAIAIGASFHAGVAIHGWFRLVPTTAATAAILAFPSPPWLVIVALAVLAAISISMAWTRAPEARRPVVALSPRGRPSRAIAMILASRLLEPLLWTRVVAAAAAFGGVAGLLLANNQLTAKTSVVTAVVSASALGSIAACVSLATALIGSRRELRWLLTSNGASAGQQTMALAVLSLTVGSLFGLAVSAAALLVVQLTIGVTFLAAVLACVGGAVSSATLATVATAAALSRPGHRSANVWALVVLTGLGIAAITVVVGPIAFVAVVLLSAAAIHRIYETIDLGRESTDGPTSSHSTGGQA